MPEKRFALVPLALMIVFLLAMPLLYNLWQQFNPIAAPWKDEVIYYYNDSQYDTTLRAAMDRWESTGLDIEFRETRSRNAADLLVFSDKQTLRDKCSSPRCLGWAHIGHSAFRRAEMYLHPPVNIYEEQIQDMLMLNVVIHELGHILGLRHNKEMCSIMNTSSACSRIAEPRVAESGSRIFCGPWASDVEELGSLYRQDLDVPASSCLDEEADSDFYRKHGQSILHSLEQAQID